MQIIVFYFYVHFTQHPNFFGNGVVSRCWTLDARFWDDKKLCVYCFLLSVVGQACAGSDIHQQDAGETKRIEWASGDDP